MQYCRTPRAEGYSPIELLNGRQIRTRIDILLPSPAHTAQGKQAREATKSQAREVPPERVTPIYSVGTPCFALYCGPRREKEARWVPAVVTKVFGTRSVNVRVFLRGGSWRRHIEQFHPRYGTQEDADPGGNVSATPMEPFLGSPTIEVATSMPDTQVPLLPTQEAKIMAQPMQRYRNPRLPTGEEYTRDNPRRSTRQHHQQTPSVKRGYCLSVINGGLQGWQGGVLTM